MTNKKTIIQVLGPTGIGKSAIAIQLALSLSGEIISADAMQVYQGFNIGTDKIRSEHMSAVRHHLIDVIGDCSQYNASRFLSESFRATQEIEKRGNLAIICGGTALYLRMMIHGIFPDNKNSRVKRDFLERVLEKRGLDYLWARLHRVDPEYAEKIGKNDRIRVVRALEIYYNNKTPPTEMFKKTQTPFKQYNFCRIGLDLDREHLYQRINQRVDRMLANGLMQEVTGLMDFYPLSCPPFKSVGYRELVMVLQNKLKLQDAILLIKQRSRNFAKRQLSWFRREKDITWFKANQIEAIKEYCNAFIGDLE